MIKVGTEITLRVGEQETLTKLPFPGYLMEYAGMPDIGRFKVHRTQLYSGNSSLVDLYFPIDEKEVKIGPHLFGVLSVLPSAITLIYRGASSRELRQGTALS